MAAISNPLTSEFPATFPSQVTFSGKPGLHFTAVLMFCASDGFLQIVPAFLVLMCISGLKCSFTLANLVTDLRVNVWFLVGKWPDCFCWNALFFAGLDEVCDHCGLLVQVRGWVSEHIPVHRVKAVLKFILCLTRPALHCVRHQLLTLKFLFVIRKTSPSVHTLESGMPHCVRCSNSQEC